MHRYLPGRNARPEEGDLTRHGLVAIVPPERLHETELFRYGVDLYNRSYFWEAHEAWETLWQRCPEGPIREALQGLIQLAAALLKEHLGVPSGALRLAEAACGRLERSAAHVTFGFDLLDLTRRAREHFTGKEPRMPAPGIRLLA